MKPTKISFLLIAVALIISQSISSQEDKVGKKKSININATTIPLEKTKSLNINATNGFKSAYKNSLKTKTQAQIDAELKNKGIITAQMLAQMRMNKNAEKFSFQIPMVDKDLGSFNTKSANINIKSLDYGMYDGDVVSIYKNGILMVDNYTLKSHTKTFKIPLDIGFNQIEILAIDEGKYRPNTGSFTFYDDFGDVVKSDYWALAKGAKVKALIIRNK